MARRAANSDGTSRNQAAPGSRGPWFLVERIFLIGGVERSEFIPSGTLVFGVRTPEGLEFGVGPSVTIGSLGASTAIVAAAGQTLRYGAFAFRSTRAPR